MRLPTGILRSLALALPALALLVGLGDQARGGLADGTADAESRMRKAMPKRAQAGLVQLRLLGVNDFHGHLESPGARRRGDGPAVPVGGAAVLGAHLDRAAAELPGGTIRVHAGDMVGASPLLSSHFHDEPTVEAMNLMRFDVGTLGNHEFDEGTAEMLRLLRGGRRRDGQALKRDADGRLVNTSHAGFEGARFPYIAANTVDGRGRLLLPPTAIVERAGVKVGFIGVTTDTTPDYLLPRHRAGLRFLDISRTVNSYVPQLRAQGVRAIVVLAHSGAHETRGAAGAKGEIIDEAAEMSDDVDVVVAGHTHSHLNVEVDGKLVVEALSFGTAYDEVDLTVERATGEVVSKSARTPTTWADEVAPEPRLNRLVRGYARRVAPLARQVLGHTPRRLRRPDAVPGNAPRGLSSRVADAQRELARTDVAFVNAGNMRANLGSGPVTLGDLFRVAPFEHRVLRMELSGADILRLLAQQAAPEPAVWLHTSGMRWGWVDGGVVDAVMADGRPLRPERTYTVAANELLVGTARFSVLAERGRGARPVGTDLEALVRHFQRSGGAG